MQYVLLQKHVAFLPVAVRLIKHRPVPGRYHFTLNDPTKRRTGAVEF